MLFSERMNSIGRLAGAQAYGTARFPAYKAGKNLTAFAIPDQYNPVHFHLFILFPTHLKPEQLTREDIEDSKRIIRLPYVSKIVMSKEDGSAAEDTFRMAFLRAASLFDLEKVVADSLMRNLWITCEDYPWYRWTQHPRIVKPVMERHYEWILPVTVEIAPTLNCTNRCGSNEIGAGCSFKEAKKLLGVWNGPNDFHNPEIHMQSWEVMRAIINKLFAGGVNGFVFTGGGEPILNRATIPGIRYVKERGGQVEFFTNGSGLNQNLIDQLAEANPDEVRISLNAGTEEAHRRHHNYLRPGVNYFEKVVRNIEALAEKRSKSGSPQSFGVGYLISDRNLYDLKPAGEFLLSIVDRLPGGINFVTIRPEVDYYGSKIIDLPGYAYEINVAKQLFYEFEKRGVSLRYFARIPTTGKLEKGYKRCLALRAFGEVGPSGKMFQCCDRNAHPHYKVGDLLTSSVEEIFTGKEYQGLLDRMNTSGLSLCPPLCKPHRLNLIFNQIEELRQQGLGKEVEEWITAQQQLPHNRLHHLL